MLIMNRLNKLSYFYLIAFGVIVIDQLSKYLVHQNMIENFTDVHLIGDVFKLHYVTNPGMAFGMQIGGDYGKILLTVFRIFAMGGIAFAIKRIYDQQMHKGFILCVSLILGGAIGNLLDSIFYAVLDPTLIVEGASTPWFHGKVIDMFYFDIASGFYPETWPIVGGQYYSFWPIFNVADAAIFIAVCIIIARQKTFLGENNSLNIFTFKK